MKLKNNIAIVTGASREIGKAIVIAFAKEGAIVLVIDISKNFFNWGRRSNERKH